MTTTRISLRLDDLAGAARRGWPVTQGIPFAEGDLPAGTPVRVVGPAGPLPTQTAVLATWRPDRRDVKWLLVDFQTGPAAGEAGAYYLEYGDGAAPPAPATPVALTEDRRSVRIDTGRLRLMLDRTSPDWFAGLEMGDGAAWRSPLAGPPWLSMTDQRGETHDSRAGRLQPRIVVEEAGPLRACVRISGYHTSADGRPFCPYMLRLHLFAGRADIHLFHTFIFDQEPDLCQLRAVGMHWPLSADGAVFGGADGQAIHAGVPAAFLQSADDVFTVTAGEMELARGDRTQGWCRLGPLTAVLRDCWQEYPKGLIAGDDGLTLAFWPEDAGRLDYRNPCIEPPLQFPGRAALDEEVFLHSLRERPGAPLRLKSVNAQTVEEVEHLRDLVARHAPGNPWAYCDMDIGKAWGTAKTHEAWLRFDADPVTDDDCEAYARAAQQPPLALPPPDYLCGTGAVRMMHPADPARFPEAETALEQLFDHLVLEPRDVCRIYGMLDYGELINGHNTADPLVYRSFKRTPAAWERILEVLGVFNNEAQDVIKQLWTFYLRTGERKYFTCAEAKSEHTADVDFVHAHPGFAQVFPHPNRPEWCVGLMHYHNQYHWSGPYVASHSLVSGLMMHYYLTGNRRLFEVARACADQHVRNQTRDGLIRGAGLHREVTGPLQNLLELYQATWEPKYRHVARATLELLHRLRNATGNLPHMLFFGDDVRADGAENRTGYPGGMLCYVLYDAYQLWPEPWLRDWIVQLADAWVHGIRCDEYIPASVVTGGAGASRLTAYRVAEGWYWHSFSDYASYFFDPLVALAWRVTGNPQYLGYLAHRVRAFPPAVRDAWRHLSGHAFNVINHLGDAVPAALAAVAAASPEEVEEALRAWKAQRTAEGLPVYDGPRIGYADDGTPPGEPVVITLCREW